MFVHFCYQLISGLFFPPQTAIFFLMTHSDTSESSATIDLIEATLRPSPSTLFQSSHTLVRNYG